MVDHSPADPKPCPFCGEKPKQDINVLDIWQHPFNGCALHGMGFFGIAKWNDRESSSALSQRPGETDASEQIEALEDAIDTLDAEAARFEGRALNFPSEKADAEAAAGQNDRHVETLRGMVRDLKQREANRIPQRIESARTGFKKLPYCHACNTRPCQCSSMNEISEGRADARLKQWRNEAAASAWAIFARLSDDDRAIAKEEYEVIIERLDLLSALNP